MNHADERAEIRLLGPMLVRRDDGSVVEASEWRTQKTVDLLRLLALSPGMPVPTERLLGQLWGDAAAQRARASLRTATYRIRQVLGDHVVQRRGSGLVLEDVWVDAQAYESLAGEVDRSHRMQTHQNTVAVTREAEAMYLGDLDGQDSPECLDDAAVRLRGLRHRMLLDAAEAALALNWMHDALDFATCARDIDQQSERATRALMRALAGTGELEAALTVFEHLRQDLAERLGVDPSPHTRALHIALLSGTVSRPAYSVAVRRDTATASLVSALSRIRLAGSGGLVLVRGERGSGRTSVVEAACAELGVTAHAPGEGGTTSILLSRGVGEAPRGTVVLLPARREVSAAEVHAAAVAAQDRGWILVVPTEHIDPDVDAMPAVRGDAGAVVSVSRLTTSELTDLARRAFQGEPTRGLVHSLEQASAGLAGVAFAVAREWLLAGRVVWTPDGLDLTTAATTTMPLPSADRIQRLLRAMDWRAIDVLGVTAVMATGVVAEDAATVLTALHPGCRLDAAAVLDRLTDSGLLTVTAQGYVFRTQHDRALVLGWLRPALRRRLHRAIGEIPRLDPVERARHLIASGAHQEACDVGVLGLNAACEEGDTDIARTLIGVLEQLPGRLQADGADRSLRDHLPEMAARLRLSWSGVAGLAVVALAKVAETYHRNQTVLVDTLAAVA